MNKPVSVYRMGFFIRWAIKGRKQKLPTSLILVAVFDFIKKKFKIS
jgi:hypothetical protein